MNLDDASFSANDDVAECRPFSWNRDLELSREAEVELGLWDRAWHSVKQADVAEGTQPSIRRYFISDEVYLIS